MYQASCSFCESEDGLLSVKGADAPVDDAFCVRRFVFFDRVCLGDRKGVAYEPLAGFLLSLVFRVFGGWLFDSAMKRYYLIRVPNCGRVELYISELTSSAPHAKVFAYRESDVDALKEMAVRYANYQRSE